VILIGSELFTNGIEWFGHKLELGEGAIGSVLAAIGTALPETMVPLIAILFGGGIAASEVGVGAILGAPFMLATLTMFVTGFRRPASAKAPNQRNERGREPRASWATTWPTSPWPTIAIGAAFLPVEYEWPRRLVPLCCSSACTAYYVWGHLQAEAAEHEALEPLRFHKLDRGAPQHPAPPRCSSCRPGGLRPGLHHRRGLGLRAGLSRTWRRVHSASTARFWRC
jgi:cation:H+ antiporter